MRQAVIWWALPPQLKIFTDIPANERRELYPEEVNDIAEEFVSRLDSQGRTRYGDEVALPAIKWVDDVKDVMINVTGKSLIDTEESGDDENVKWVIYMASNCVGIVMSAKMAEQMPTMYGFWTDDKMKPIAAPYLWVKPTRGRRISKAKAAPQIEHIADEDGEVPEQGEEFFKRARVVKKRKPVAVTKAVTKRKSASKKKAAPKRKVTRAKSVKPVAKKRNIKEKQEQDG